MKTIYSTPAFHWFLATSVQAQAGTHQSNAGIKGGYNLVVVLGDGETGQRQGFHIGVYGESFISESFLSNPNYCILNKGMKLKMLMARLPKTGLYQFTNTAKSPSKKLFRGRSTIG
jgi:hypothetical protein